MESMSCSGQMTGYIRFRRISHISQKQYNGCDVAENAMSEKYSRKGVYGKKEFLRTESFCRLKEDAVKTIAAYPDRERLMAKVEKEGINVCAALDELLKDERMEGKIEGKAEGEKEERITIIRNMLREGLGHDIICRVTGCSAKEFTSALTK